MPGMSNVEYRRLQQTEEFCRKIEAERNLPYFITHVERMGGLFWDVKATSRGNYRVAPSREMWVRETQEGLIRSMLRLATLLREGNGVRVDVQLFSDFKGDRYHYSPSLWVSGFVPTAADTPREPETAEKTDHPVCTCGHAEGLHIGLHLLCAKCHCPEYTPAKEGSNG